MYGIHIPVTSFHSLWFILHYRPLPKREIAQKIIFKRVKKQIV